MKLSTSFQYIKSLKSMKQLEFDFSAVPEVVKEIKKVVNNNVPHMSYAELEDIKAGRAFASKRQVKILKSYF